MKVVNSFPPPPPRPPARSLPPPSLSPFSTATFFFSSFFIISFLYYILFFSFSFFLSLSAQRCSFSSTLLDEPNHLSPPSFPPSLFLLHLLPTFVVCFVPFSSLSFQVVSALARLGSLLSRGERSTPLLYQGRRPRRR